MGEQAGERGREGEMLTGRRMERAAMGRKKGSPCEHGMGQRKEAGDVIITLSITLIVGHKQTWLGALVEDVSPLQGQAVFFASTSVSQKQTDK